jgi:hypothetical protein
VADNDKCIRQLTTEYCISYGKKTPVLFRRPWFFYLKDILLQPVSLGEQCPSPPPPIPSPPSQFLAKRHNRSRSAAAGSMLKGIAHVAVTFRKKFLIEMIVQPVS